MDEEPSASSSHASDSSNSSSDDENIGSQEEAPQDDREQSLPEAYHVVVPHGLSDETHLLLKEIRRQRILFDNRAADRVCSKTRMADFMAILTSHGIRMERIPIYCFRTQLHKRYNYFSPIRNVTGCLKEIRFLEDNHGKELWILQFLVLHNLLVDISADFGDELFRSSVINIYMGCADAINKRNWPMIAKIISDINFSFNLATKKKKRVDGAVPYSEVKLRKELLKLGRRTRFLVFYLTSLFLASVQRHLQLYESPDLTIGLIDATIAPFENSCKTSLSLWCNPSSFFMLTGMIYKICHGFYENVSRIIDAPLLQTDPDWQRIFLLYKLIAEYETFCLDKNPQHAQSLLGSVDGQIESIQHNEQKLILLPVLIELCVYLGEGELLFEKINDLCMDCPFIFTHVCKILVANGCKDAPLSLFQDLITAKTDRLSPIDVTPALLRVYSEEPSKYGPVTEIIKTNLQVAFRILDYGRNRNNIDAWQSLHMNLRYVENDPEIANEFWTPRKDWWPKFHSSEVDHDCTKVRRKCFRRLNALE